MPGGLTKVKLSPPKAMSPLHWVGVTPTPFTGAQAASWKPSPPGASPCGAAARGLGVPAMCRAEVRPRRLSPWAAACLKGRSPQGLAGLPATFPTFPPASRMLSFLPGETSPDTRIPGQRRLKHTPFLLCPSFVLVPEPPDFQRERHLASRGAGLIWAETIRDDPGEVVSSPQAPRGPLGKRDPSFSTMK